MRLVRADEGIVYDAPQHFGTWSQRKIGPEQGVSGLVISVSHFLPDGGASMSASKHERFYYVISGSLVVKGAREEYTLAQGDLLHIAPGEEREIRNTGYQPATILVVMREVGRSAES